MHDAMTRIRGLGIRVGIELLSAVAVFAWVLTADVGRIGAAGPSGIVGQTLSFALIAFAVGSASLSIRLSVGVVGALLLVQLLVPVARFDQNSWPIYGVLAYVAFTAGQAKARSLKWLSLGALAGSAVIAALLLTLPQLDAASDVGIINGLAASDTGLGMNAATWSATIVGLVFLVWLAGAATEARVARATRERERQELAAALSSAELELRTTLERDRIAHEVHDIMAHSLAVIVAQADGARYLIEKRPEATRHSLEAIATAARESLVEVRMLIDSLNLQPEGHSRPTIDQLDSLIARMADAGLRVGRTDTGTPQKLLTSQQMAAYRIVQESLTNALKHADTSREAELHLQWAPGGLTVSVTSFGQTTRDIEQSTGHGIRGMRERARLAGGWFTAGPDDHRADAFTVTAFLPVHSVLTTRTPAPEEPEL